jgi:Bax protein|tara:strand:+ start:9866 stop:11353 length:1488 start_codon:yes stop_codon:yes gene_type:complete
MKKIVSYRDKLIELANIYRIAEVLNYIKNKKYLSTPQLEHLLKKNKVPIPTEINKTIFEIQARKIKKPFYNVGYKFERILKNNYKELINSFTKLIKSINNVPHLLVNGVLNFLSFISKSTINILNNAYYFKIEEKKTHKFFTQVIGVSFVILFLIGGYNIKNIISTSNSVKIENKDDKELKKEIAKTPEKDIKPRQKKAAKTSEKKIELKQKELTKKPEKKVEPKQKESVKEFVLPDLNIKTRTILTLFDDVNYDLKKVRNNKLVKPIYFTQFPKDLDEITSVQLKKETFIKIVLPLVVAENQKILDDRLKLQNIMKKKMTSEKEKSWLRQKLKEYKVKKGDINKLERRMDIIPVSIAIAQAAKESGWGTSRFALEGNAIFGQWTWNGKGIAPLERNKEQTHKILRFPILRASVKAYKNNLNTHNGYQEFRKKRSLLRKRKSSIDGMKLIHSLDNYAQNGKEYTKILAKIMEQNSLKDFENVKLTNTVIKKQLSL